MRIQHNIAAMNAYRNYNTNTSAVAKNLEKLSSGYKINRAGDDAAGLAISEKMRAQITGLEAAQKNVKDGISLVKTAEGAMQEVQDMLNRMVSLASQSANGTYDNEVDRANLQKEVDQLKAEINRIADSSNFNGIKLLDGSLDSTGRTKTVDFMDIGVLPDISTGKVGSGTVLHSTAATDNGGTSFSIDLHNTTFANAKNGDTMTIKVGDNTLSLVSGQDGLTAGSAMDAKAIVDALANKYANGVEIDGQMFDVAADKDANGDARLTFTQRNAPTKASEEVDPSKEVTISGDGVGGSFGAAGKAGLKGEAGDAVDAATAANGSFDFTGLNKEAIGKVMESLGITADQDDDLEFIAIAGGGYQLQIGGNVVAKTGAADNTITAGSGGNAVDSTLKLYAVDADGNVTSTSVGNVVATSADGKTADAATAVATGLTYEDGKAAELTAPDNVTITPANVGTASAATTYTIDLDGLDVDKATTLSIRVGEKTYDIEVTQAEVDAKATTAIANVVAGKLVDALKADKGLNLTDGDATFAITGDNTGTTVTFTSDTNNTADESYELNLGQGISVEVKANPSGDSAYADYNKSTTNQNRVTVDSSSNRLASTYWTLEKSMINDGAKIQIGKQSYIFTADEAKKDADGFVYIGDLKSSDGDYAAQVAERLTEAAKGNTTWTVGHDGNRMTFTEIKSQTEYQKDGSSSLTSKKAIAETFGYSGVEVSGTALTLQIGDTSDSFNQLKVSIGDIHTSALGIAGIDISNQQGAADAVNVIKNAINTVSSIRGTLGATQNRLEHTANNLSVMAENIQDAESTIRDTDIAEEMMAYTKNNILVQSAQAMLAQANQIPQGVLQLLG